eukprot:gb/GECH01008072.1/.p1 GENE.gb/GECH01008072.1/~~gb/GECH01008072.1/.p1  ORF type:complete len:488 (+),score=72.24 gb/GECH01008072.1/:1-1464(+)
MYYWFCFVILEIQSDRLYFISLHTTPRDTQDQHFFTIDDEIVYEPFFADFGPLNICQIYVFCRLLASKLQDKAYRRRRIYYYTSHNTHKRANGALLITAFMVVVQHHHPQQAWSPFQDIYPPIIPFRDASYGPCTYKLRIIDCLLALRGAMDAGLWDYHRFDAQEYAYYEQVVHGDMNWIVPGRLLAFSSPRQRRTGGMLAPEDYRDVFRAWRVTTVVRLNKKMYDRRQFTRRGFRHHDLYFEDGSVPSDYIVRRFLSIVADADGAVAVHCRAGLGRTGCLIGCYLMKTYRWNAAQTIGYLRLMRPGSVLGPQQHFLHDIQKRMWKEGEQDRRGEEGRRGSSMNTIGRHVLESQPKGVTGRSPEMRTGTRKRNTWGSRSTTLRRPARSMTPPPMPVPPSSSSPSRPRHRRRSSSQSPSPSPSPSPSRGHHQHGRHPSSPSSSPTHRAHRKRHTTPTPSSPSGQRLRQREPPVVVVGTVRPQTMRSVH